MLIQENILDTLIDSFTEMLKKNKAIPVDFEQYLLSCGVDCNYIRSNYERLS